MVEKIKKFYEDEITNLDKEIALEPTWTTTKELVNNTIQRMLAVFDFAVIQYDESYIELDEIFEEYRARVMKRI